jgi:copper ion binding protein
MKKLALVLMIAIFAMSLALPAYGCGQKTAGKDCSAACTGKATCDKDKKECKATCDAMKKDGKDCPSKPGCVCPNGKAGASKAAATSNSDVSIAPAVANSDTKMSVNLTGESGGCPMSKTGTKPADHACTAAERAKCGADKGAKTGSASSAKLPNGHPVQTVAEAMKCESNPMVVFLSVDKMTCQSCVNHITQVLGTMDGVCAVDVNLKKAAATVVFHSDKVKADDMISAINKAGYLAAMKTECTDDMKAVFGDNYKEKCLKSCVNACQGKQESKQSES